MFLSPPHGVECSRMGPVLLMIDRNKEGRLDVLSRSTDKPRMQHCEDHNETIIYTRALQGQSHGVAINPNMFILFETKRVDLEGTLAMQPEMNSNDFGRFLKLLSRFEIDFCRRGKLLKTILFFCVFGVRSHTM